MKGRGVQRWLREPLVHFISMGALLFVLHGLVGSEVREESRQELAITAEDIEGLSRKWSLVWGRPPTEPELRAMVEDQVREEVLFAEAMAMQLDQEDVVLRRRMVQKMEFLFEDLARLVEPDEAELEAFLAKRPDQFRLPDRLTFTHVYFNPDTRGERVEAEATEVLVVLRADQPERAPDLGDRFLQPLDYADLEREQIASRFGPEFARELLGLPVGTWQGPLASGFGLHLVRIGAREEGRLPTLDEVRKEVRQALQAERRDKANAELYAAIRARYRVTIDEQALIESVSRDQELE